MSINIKNQQALAARIARERRRRGREAIDENLLEIGRQYSALPDRDTRSADEILGYDEHDLPTCGMDTPRG